MTSHTAKQITTMHILPNILRSKCNKRTKFGQLIEYNIRNIFLQNSCKKWGRVTISRLFLFFEKALYKVKAKDQQFSTWVHNKNNLHHISGCWSKDMPNFGSFM